MRAFVSIDYEDGNQANYRGVNLTIGDDKKFFASGDPVKDWYLMIKELIHQPNGFQGYLESSSVNHFFFDGDAYQNAYLLHVGPGENDWEFASSEQKSQNPRYYEQGIEFIVPSDGSISSWKALRVYCEPDVYGVKQEATV